MTARAGRIRVFVTGAALLSVTTLAVSGVNYLLNFALGRMLSRTLFADAVLAITLVLCAAVVAATLQLVAARTVAAHPEQASAVRRALIRAAAIAGTLAALGFAGGAGALADLLRTSTPWMFVIIGAGLPVYFVQAVHRGIRQGSLQFGRLAASYAAEAVVRVTVVLGLVAAGWGVIGVSVGILLSFLASAAVAWTGRGARGGERLGPGVLGVTAGGAVIMLLAQVLLTNADLVLAKAAFEPATAGVYAAAAVLCRSLSFVSWSIVQAGVPVQASATSTPAERRRAFAFAFAAISGLGALAIAVAATAGGMLVRTLFGPSYAGAAALLPPYTIATALLSLATLLAAVDVARGRRVGPVVMLLGALLQIAVLIVAGHTPQAMAWWQVGTTGLIITVLAALAVVRALCRAEPVRTPDPRVRRRPRRTTRPSSPQRIS